jgi:hypothetical protein
VVSAQLTAAKASGRVWRVGFRPEPWTWSGWEWATDGRLPGRWDDLHGITSVAGAQRSEATHAPAALLVNPADVVLDPYAPPPAMP